VSLKKYGANLMKQWRIKIIELKAIITIRVWGVHRGRMAVLSMVMVLGKHILLQQLFGSIKRKIKYSFLKKEVCYLMNDIRQ